MAPKKKPAAEGEVDMYEELIKVYRKYAFYFEFRKLVILHEICIYILLKNTRPQYIILILYVTFQIDKI